KPVNLSPELEAVVGKGPLTRAQVTSKVWDHIKANGLQDKTDKRMINPDAGLRPGRGSGAGEAAGGLPRPSSFRICEIFTNPEIGLSRGVRPWHHARRLNAPPRGASAREERPALMATIVGGIATS